METLHSTAIMITGVPKKEHCTTETNYVDLGSTNAAKVLFSGEGNQQAVFKSKDSYEKHKEGHTDQRKREMEVSFDISDTDLKMKNVLKGDTDATSCEPEETDYTDLYLNSRCESESESEHESEQDVHVSEETESHYITTHEIQLTELDHDIDHELGRAASSCWDYEDDNLVYSFVDYASFTSGEQPNAERGQRRASSGRPPKLAATKSLISTESECASSDDGVRNAGAAIKTSSQTVNESVRPSPEKNELLRRYHETQAKIEVPYDSRHEHCFIPAPGRQHLASKLMKGKDVTEYSSGASSSVSELDDADKEVRNLTAKSFRSLACPYFDTIDLRPSSESSVSEHSLSMNKWSSFIDFNYRNYMMQSGVLAERRNSTCSVEMRKRAESGSVNVNAIIEAKCHQTNSSKYQLSCNTERHVKCTQDGAKTCDTSTSRTRDPADICLEGAQKTAVFASSLLQNVISKKMQFEQKHKLVCGEIRARSANKDGTSSKGLQRQSSESGSVHSATSIEDNVEGPGAANYKGEGAELPKAPCTPTIVNTDEPLTASLLEESVGFASETGGTMVPKLNAERDADTTALTGERKENNKAYTNVTNSTETKMSHLYVSGSQFIPKESEVLKASASLTQTANPLQSDGNSSSKPPGITIHLHSIKENKNNPQHPLNIASLLTPNLSKQSEKVPHFTVRDVRDSRCRLQTPIHQVRDVRKLVKSSYRFVSLETEDSKTAPREESHGVKKEPDKTPMVIKCHSVNTNTNSNADSLTDARCDLESENLRMPTISEQQELQIKSSRWKESCEKRVECKMTNQAALEKLKAAVKSMEQLYVFDRNEWRRKTAAPRSMTDSHVLSLITSEEQGVDERIARAEPSKYSTHAPDSSFTGTITHHLQQASKSQCFNVSSSTRSPVSLKICPLRSTAKQRVGNDGELASPTSKSVPKPQPAPVSDSENYFTIPIKPPASETSHHASEQIPNPAPQLQPHPHLQRSPVITESWPPQSPTLTFCQPAQILRVTPPTDPLTSNTQRKLLLDPLTGQCYLVDTPATLQPVSQRLYCPDSAQYLDVPVALSPAAYLICPTPFVQSHSAPVYSHGENTSAGASTERGGAKPVISITSQQGPRIVAPPSFDGTTMSFVVEHR